jgi:hypothetical protein
MSSFKKFDLEKDFAVGVYLSEAQSPIHPPPLHTVGIRLYNIIVHTGKGGEGELNQGEC